MKIEPYLFFEGRCEEAVEFYRKALGAKVQTLMRYSDSPEPVPARMLPPGGPGKVMHASFTIGDSRLMASDGPVQGRPDFRSFSLGISAASEAEAEKLFAALADGGEVRMPLAKTFFAAKFGMVADRFGVGWMVIAGDAA